MPNAIIVSLGLFQEIGLAFGVKGVFLFISLVLEKGNSIFGIVTESRMESWQDWKWQLRNRVQTPEKLESYTKVYPEDREAISACRDRLEFGISPYYASLMDPQDRNCPIRLQAIPRDSEWIRSPGEVEDPLAEESNMPVPGVTHRYPDRALWYLSHQCAVYCRFCTRKRKVSQSRHTPRREDWESALGYFRQTPNIREVILSGGDPLSLGENHLDYILQSLQSIPHIRYLRVHSRYPVTLPMRITDELCSVFSRYFPIYLVTHFNHAKECTVEARTAVRKLVTQGNVQVLNQTVLLRGVNDSVDALEELNYSLLAMGVKPYYLHQCDQIYGISHFQVPISRGLELYQGLRGRMSGIAVPLYVVDLVGGGGKVPLVPEYRVETKSNTYIYRNYQGNIYEIADGESRQ